MLFFLVNVAYLQQALEHELTYAIWEMGRNKKKRYPGNVFPRWITTSSPGP